MQSTIRLVCLVAVLVLTLFEGQAQAKKNIRIPSLNDLQSHSSTSHRVSDSGQTRNSASNVLGKRAVSFSFGEAVGGSGAHGGCDQTAQDVINDGFSDVTSLANNAATAATSSEINAVRLKNFLFPSVGGNVLAAGYSTIASPPDPVVVWCGTASLAKAVEDQLNALISSREIEIDDDDKEGILGFGDGLTARLQAECTLPGFDIIAYSAEYFAEDWLDLADFYPADKFIFICDNAVPGGAGNANQQMTRFQDAKITSGLNLDQFSRVAGVVLLHELTHLFPIGITTGGNGVPTTDLGYGMEQCDDVTQQKNAAGGKLQDGQSITAQNNAGSWELFAAGVADLAHGPSNINVAWVGPNNNIQKAP